MATNLFLEKGYAGTSLVEIAKCSGVATRTIYQHFGDKEAIFRAVLFAPPSEIPTPLPAMQPDDPLVVSLTNMANYLYASSLDQPTIDLLRLFVAESQRFPELIKKIIDAVWQKNHNDVATMFRSLAEFGMIADTDHAASANIFIDLILGSSPLMVLMNWRPRPSADDTLKKINVFVNGRFNY